MRSQAVRGVLQRAHSDNSFSCRLRVEPSLVGRHLTMARQEKRPNLFAFGVCRRYQGDFQISVRSKSAIRLSATGEKVPVFTVN